MKKVGYLDLKNGFIVHINAYIGYCGVLSDAAIIRLYLKFYQVVMWGRG